MNNLFSSIRYSQIFKIFLFIFVFTSCNENSIYSEIPISEYDNEVVEIELRSSLADRLSQDDDFHKMIKMSRIVMQSVLNRRNRVSRQQNILEVVATKHELEELITQDELSSAMNVLGFSEEHTFDAFEREYNTAIFSLQRNYPELSTMEQSQLNQVFEDAITIIVADNPELLAGLPSVGLECDLDLPRNRDGSFACVTPTSCLEEAIDAVADAAANARFQATICGVGSTAIFISLGFGLSGISGGNAVIGFSLSALAASTVFNECTDAVIGVFETKCMTTQNALGRCCNPAIVNNSSN